MNEPISCAFYSGPSLSAHFPGCLELDECTTPRGMNMFSPSVGGFILSKNQNLIFLLVVVSQIRWANQKQSYRFKLISCGINDYATNLSFRGLLTNHSIWVNFCRITWHHPDSILRRYTFGVLTSLGVAMANRVPSSTL